MFISKKRWSEMERRVSALEKQSKIDCSPLSRMKEAMNSAISKAVYQFEYELTNYPEPNSVRPFSTERQPDKSKTFSLEKVKEAMKTALSNAEYRFEYELTENREPGHAVRFSTSQKQDSAP